MTSSNHSMSEDFIGLLTMLLDLIKNQDWATFEEIALSNENMFRLLSNYISRCEELNGETLRENFYLLSVKLIFLNLKLNARLL
mmetsp:Transcript_18172/g.39283  ORF Transcript_18172/g.39283 Transcript_18172/m.39283 type:complete len:84 (+) Transcript_18172:224-475(+)